MPLSGMPRSQYLDIKFGGFNNAKPMYDNMVAQATSESLKINFDIVKQTPNTLKSHFLILYAQQFQKTSEVLTAIFNSYFTLGQDIGDEAILTAIANNYFDFDPKPLNRLLNPPFFLGAALSSSSSLSAIISILGALLSTASSLSLSSWSWSPI